MDDSRDLIQKISSLSVRMGSVAVWWLGQAGYSFKMGQTTIYLDLYLSNIVGDIEGLNRLVPPPTLPWRIDNANLVLATHDHLDHTDCGTIPFLALKNRDAVFIGPPSAIKKMVEWGVPEKHCSTIKAKQRLEIQGVELEAVPALHTEDSIGYIIRGNEVTIYHSGDTLFFSDLAELGTVGIDLAFIPINGKGGNMGIPETVETVKLLRPKVAIPMHYGMFAESTADPSEFEKAVQKELPGQTVKLLSLGQLYLYEREGRS